MTRAMFATAAVLAAVLAASAAPARAVSVGVYGSAGAGLASTEDWGSWGDEDWGERDTWHGGAGFVLDTASGYSPFSYRLGVGWERIVGESDHGGPDGEMEGLVIDQDFAWALAAGPSMRFWLGPELRLGFLEGSLDGAPGGDRSWFAAGIGPVLGFDLGLSPGLALSWKLGYLYTGYTTDDSWEDDRYHDDERWTSEGHAYASMAILFRLGGGPPPAAYQQPSPAPSQYQPPPPPPGYPPPPPPPSQYPPPGRW